MLDITAAYLNGKIEDDVYLDIPELYTVDRSRFDALKLNKGLYGLKQSGVAWNCTLHKYLTSNGFKQCAREPCLYNTTINETKAYVMVYVDDIIVVSPNEKTNGKVIKILETEFKTSGASALKELLGVAIDYDLNTRKIVMSTPRAIKALLVKNNLTEVREVSTPMEIGDTIRKNGNDKDKLSHDKRAEY
jgi:Reverse transcriptase (RNA-dependent DNA polymerase)